MRINLARVKLNAEELAVLIDYGTRTYKDPGGFQYLIKALYARLDRGTGELDLDDNLLLGRAIRYAICYGPGGFQDSFLRPLFRRTLTL
jgi:hypothetical protein